MAAGLDSGEHRPKGGQGVTDSGFAPVYVEQMAMHDFRGITHCHIDFEPKLTLLVGRNNAGKSRLLRALGIALGAISADSDDLTVGSDKEPKIDLILAPCTSGDFNTPEEFDDRARRRLETIQLVADSPVRERFCWRTTLSRSSEGYGVRVDHHLMQFNLDRGEWFVPSNPSRLRQAQRTIVAADLVHPQRDLVNELGRQTSSIRRILSELDIPPEKRGALEARLADVSEEIVSSSGSLGELKNSLSQLSEAVDALGVPDLQPLPTRLEELARSVSVGMDTGDGHHPMRLHGAGSRSLSSLQIQGVLYNRRLGRDGPALRPHPVSLIEEPEAHLHPQAQFELENLMGTIPGQTIVSTHSAHLASVAEPSTIRILKASSSGPTIIDLRPRGQTHGGTSRLQNPRLHEDEIEKLRRFVERPFGELVFASAVIIGDGATERALLPPVIRHVFKGRAHGVCVIDPGSMKQPGAAAAVKFARFVGIPWLLFSDSDDDGTEGARRLIEQHAESGMVDPVVWIGKGDSSQATAAATEQMFLDFDVELCRRACDALGIEGAEEKQNKELLRLMVGKKGVMGRVLASELLSAYPCSGDVGLTSQWPEPLHKLALMLDTMLPTRLVVT